jgi:hypothetical protein
LDRWDSFSPTCNAIQDLHTYRAGQVRKNKKGKKTNRLWLGCAAFGYCGPSADHALSCGGVSFLQPYVVDARDAALCAGADKWTLTVDPGSSVVEARALCVDAALAVTVAAAPVPWLPHPAGASHWVTPVFAL